MKLALRQLLALASVQRRAWFRVPGPGRAPVDAGGRRLLLMVMRLLFLPILGGSGWAFGRQLEALHPRSAHAALPWILLGLVTGALGQGLATQIPLPRQRAMQLLGAFTEPLPLTLTARIAALVVGQAIFLAYWFALFYTVDGRTAVFGVLSVWIAGVLWGIALGKAIRTVLPGNVAARLRWVSMVLIFAGMYSPFIASIVVGRMKASLPRWERFADALLGGRPWPMAEAIAAAMLAACAACAALFAAERASFDRTDPLTGDRVKARGGPALLTIARLETLVQKREPGRTLTSVMLFVSLMLGALPLVLARIDQVSDQDIGRFGAVVRLLVAQGGFVIATTRSQRSVARDVAARPLLGGLPITPRDTLAGKTRHLRLELVVFALPLVVLLLGVAHPWSTDLWWRVPLVVATLVLYADAAISVAFLSHGLGAVTPRDAMLSLESMLAAGPFLGTLLSPTFLPAALSFGSLVALRFEARRSALRVLDWIDDAAEATPVWRALLVFAGFQAIQALVAPILAIFLSPGHAAGGGYIVAAGALVLLTLQGRPAPARVRPRPAFLALGAAAGLGTGLLGLGYVVVLRHLGGFEEPPAMPWLLGVAVVAAAPLAEELFFRGWLQRSIAGELPRKWVRIAPIITALVFASVHPPVSFVPVLALGLVTGVLFAKSSTVHAGVVAHAVHNAIALALPLVITR